MLPAVTDSPWTGAEIVAGLRRVHAESVVYWATFDDTEFFQRAAPDVWAAVDQVRHLTKSLRAICVAYEMPRPLVALRFGIALRPSRQYQPLRASYEERLESGLRAGPFSPKALDAAEQTQDGRGRVMQYHAEAVERICRGIERYSEWSLDRFRVRHPALGMITLREMAMFALLHNVHHVHVADRRRSRPAS